MSPRVSASDAQSGVQCKVRLSKGMHLWLSSTAKANNRSLNAEIVHRLLDVEDRPEPRTYRVSDATGDEPVVTIEMNLSVAQRISDGLSDIALWCHGFNAALSAEESHRRPWGTGAIADINLRIKAATREPF